MNGYYTPHYISYRNYAIKINFLQKHSVRPTSMYASKCKLSMTESRPVTTSYHAYCGTDDIITYCSVLLVSGSGVSSISCDRRKIDHILGSIYLSTQVQGPGSDTVL